MQQLGYPDSHYPLAMHTAGKMFPQNWTRSIFLAEHGSGDRKLSLGYRIMNLVVEPAGKVISYTIFAQGWLQDRVKHIFFGDALLLHAASALDHAVAT